MWALLANEAVLLGDCVAAAEYLAAAQKHNDAFHDRDNIIRYKTPTHFVRFWAHRFLDMPNDTRAISLLRVPLKLSEPPR